MKSPARPAYANTKGHPQETTATHSQHVKETEKEKEIETETGTETAGATG